MSKRKGPTPRRKGDPPWTPFERSLVPAPDGSSIWQNSRYTVIVAVSPAYIDASLAPVHLSLRRNDREAGPFPWRDLQRIKSELVGSDAEAVELFPAAGRLMDGANQRHLFCTRPGERLPLGMPDTLRAVMDDDALREFLRTEEGAAYLRNANTTAEALLSKGRQAPSEDGKDYDLGHAGLIWKYEKGVRVR